MDFPSDCSHCFAYKKGGFSNRLKALFMNRAKDCYNCPFINGCLHRKETKKPIDDAARVVKDRVIENNLMPLTGDQPIPTLKTGVLHLSGKSRNRFLTHAHHNYDVEAAIYAWNNAGMLKEPRVRAMGEGKDMQDPKAIANIEKKKKRHVKDYIEYKLDYQGRQFLVKLERMDFGQEQFYSIIEE